MVGSFLTLPAGSRQGRTLYSVVNLAGPLVHIGTSKFFEISASGLERLCVCLCVCVALRQKLLASYRASWFSLARQSLAPVHRRAQAVIELTQV